METATTPSHLGFRERWLTTGLLGIGLITFAISASVTNLILPKIMTSLRVELYQIHWVLTAFGIARTIIIPALGWLSGWLGPRTLYLVCMATFCAGSLGSALAWDWASLMLFRVLMGLGGGLLQPLSMAIFYQICPPHQRGMALGFSLIGWSIGPSLGALMGGYVLEFASWRATYAMVLPIAGAGMLLAWWLLPTLRRPERRRLDFYGLLTMAITVTALLLALSQGNREGWDSQYILTLFAITAVAGLCFIIIELSHSEPLMELRLFGVMPFLMAAIVLFLSTMAFRGSGPMLNVFMQRALGFVPLLVAWTLVPVNIVYGTTVMAVGPLSDRLSPRFLVLVGLVVYAVIFFVYAGINELTTVPMMITLMMFRFIGEGFVGSPNNLTALRALNEQQVMMAAGVMGLLRSIAGTLGPALSAVFWDLRFGRYIQQYAENTPADAFGLTTAISEMQHVLTWTGEIAVQVSSKAMALLHQRLLAEASTAAWQDYLLTNTLLALLCIGPAILAKGQQHPARRQTTSADATSTPTDAAGRIASTQSSRR
jgi:DHA2 family multidrug resistance protein